MARWIEQAKPVDERPTGMSAQERWRLMQERDAALAALPWTQHTAYLSEFYDEHPTYPWQQPCWCGPCLTGRR